MDIRIDKYVNVLSEMIRYETVSDYNDIAIEKFIGFHNLLKKLFPSVFSTCSLEVFDGSLMIIWKSSKSFDKPVLLMNHHDVVEASGKWDFNPFSAEVIDGKMFGRGTLDNKGGLFAMLQAAEELIDDGYSPKRDIYFVSSCNEETTGYGADTISNELLKRGIEFEFVLDEGGMIVDEPVPGVEGSYAMVGMGEKGCADLKFIARSNGGHASTPGKNTPLVRLGRFMADVEKSDLFDSELSPTVAEMFKRLSPEMSGILGIVCKRPELFKFLLKRFVPVVSPVAGALFKTTLAFTTAKGSEGLNVLPQEAYVTGNMRFSHHQGRDSSIDEVRKIAEKYDIQIEIIDPGFESGVSDFNSDAFRLIERAVTHIFPDVKTVPYIMTAASDCRFFTRNSDNCIRFLPFKISDSQLAGIHGNNENISVDCLVSAVDFYKFIIINI